MNQLFLRFFILSILLGFLYFYLQTPSNDRDWMHYLSRVSEVSQSASSSVSISNVRDWQYEAGGVTDKTWFDSIDISPADITAVWFNVTPFGATSLAGHTFLTFELTTGEAYSFSIEARRENGEDYSAPLGVFRQYELSYVWSTERDAVTRRIIKDAEPLRLHRLDITQADAQALFMTVTDATQVLAKQPHFYNTLTANCTNLLARTINARYPDTLPYSLSWNFPGNSDQYLIKQGYIVVATSTEVTIIAAALQQHAEALEPFIHQSPVEFSTAVRAVLASN